MDSSGGGLSLGAMAGEGPVSLAEGPSGSQMASQSMLTSSFRGIARRENWSSAIIHVKRLLALVAPSNFIHQITKACICCHEQRGYELYVDEEGGGSENTTRRAVGVRPAIAYVRIQNKGSPFSR